MLDRAQPVSIDLRGTPGFEPVGLPAGGFRLFPSVFTTATYDDNVYARPDGNIDDLFIAIEPKLVVQSRWSRHRLELQADANIRRYATITAENATQYGVRANGQVDIQRDFYLSGSASYARRVETRGTSGNVFLTGRPIVYRRTSGDITLFRQFNRLSLQASGSVETFDFSNTRAGTVVIQQDFRNRRSYGGSVRASYELTPSLALFAEGSTKRLDFSGDPTRLNRDSRSASVIGGVQFGLTPLLSGQVGVGVLRQSFKDPAFPDFRGVNYNASIVWNPTTLITATLSADRSITDSALAGVGGVVSSSVMLRTEYELLRNLIVSGRVSLVRDNFRGIDRRDTRVGGSASIRYAVSRNLEIGGSYTRRDQTSAGTSLGRRYRQNVFALSAGLRL